MGRIKFSRKLKGREKVKKKIRGREIISRETKGGGKRLKEKREKIRRK